MQRKKHTLLGLMGGSLLTLLFIRQSVGLTATPAIAATLQATTTPAGSCDRQPIDSSQWFGRHQRAARSSHAATGRHIQ